MEEQIKPHQLANAIRRALAHFRGNVGPKFARVNLNLLFVRNEEFFQDLAKDIGAEWWARLVQNEARPFDPELISSMEDILAAYTQLRREYQYRSEPLARMIKGETLRKVMRNSPGRISISIIEDLDFCIGFMAKNAGKSSIYRLA